MASSIIQPLIFLLPRARAACAFAQCEVRVSWESPATGMRVFKSRSRVSREMALKESVGRRQGPALKPLRSPGSGPVEKPRAARYLLMKRDDFMQLRQCFNPRPGGCSEREVPFFGGAGRDGHRVPVTLGCFGPRPVSPLPFSPPPPGQIMQNVINQLCRVLPFS